MQQTKRIKAGGWRTVEWFWNGSGTAFFILPTGAQIKVRYGVGWLGKDSQKQTLNGTDQKRLYVSSSSSVTRARMQVRVAETADVSYLVFPGNWSSPNPS